MSDGNGYITREDLLSATAVRYCDFRIPDNFPNANLAGKKLRIRSMTAKQHAAHEDFFLDANGRVDPERDKLRREKLVIDCVVGGDDKPMFTLEDVRTLGKLDGGLIEAIAQRAASHCRMQLQADMEKKFVATDDSDSG